MLYNSVSNAALERALGASWQRMKIISNNIGNEDTPGYKAKRLSFESELAKELKLADRPTSSRRESISRLQNIRTSEYELEGLQERADGNNVSIENEQIELTRLQLQYDALQARIAGHYSNLRLAINGSR